MSDNGRQEAHGGRNRSRSPRRDRAPRRDTRYRSRSPFRRDEREGGRGGDRGRNERDRDERRPDFRGGREPPKGPRGGGAGGPRRDVKPVRAESPVEAPDVEMKEERQKPEGMDDDTWEMAKVMGFAGFKSTKNTKVPGNAKNYGVRHDKQMEARQYMNRQGGFNRPLSPGRG